jgi:hypothetical protein
MVDVHSQRTFQACPKDVPVSLIKLSSSKSKISGLGTAVLKCRTIRISKL